ncbi:MAG: hypothetical protein IGQ45_07245 [Cyanobacterium sp. T60_A2020_053]|nr:hypothetical protein [Cyanobacterium sp. T60_A2020_053]
MKKIPHLLISLLLICSLTLSACNNQAPSRFEGAQQESLEQGNRNTATADNAVEGAGFNKFFPSNEGNFERIFTQEKTGFVEAVLKESGEDIAVFTVFDTTSNPSAKEDFVNSDKEINGYPLAQKGSQRTSLLVADRFQVTVRSTSDNFTIADREMWLSKFDLNGLATLK